MSVTDYLEQARDLAALADRHTGAEKQRLMALADAWLELAEQAALDARQTINEKPLQPTIGKWP